MQQVKKGIKGTAREGKQGIVDMGVEEEDKGSLSKTGPNSPLSKPLMKSWLIESRVSRGVTTSSSESITWVSTGLVGEGRGETSASSSEMIRLLTLGLVTKEPPSSSSSESSSLMIFLFISIS